MLYFCYIQLPVTFFMGELFTYFSTSALINTITSLGLGYYLIFTSWRIRIARHLIFLCFSLGTWSLGYFMWQISDNYSDALFWTRALMVGAIFTSVTFLHLVIVFLKLDTQAFWRRLLIAFYIPCFVWEIVNLTPLFVRTVEPRMFFPFWPLPGPLYLPFLILFGVHVIIASALLYRGYKQETGKRKLQSLLLLIGITITFIGGSTNYFLWYDIPIAPWGNGVASIYVILTVYAMMKYDLLNFRIVAAEIFTFAILFLSFFNLFLSGSTTEVLFNLFTLVTLAFLGFIVIKSVRKEVNQKQEMEHLAESLEKANKRLKILDRQKTEFLSIASHQLRTPLSIIKGYIELIGDGAYGRAPKKMKQVLENMDESNERLVKLVDEFLNISRIEQGRTKYAFDYYDLNALIDSVVKELVERAAQKGIKIKVKPLLSADRVYMDDEKVRHIVFNYIDNAIKYSEQGSITVRMHTEKDGIAVRVHDEGIGFEADDEAAFFHKFYRGKNVEGTNVNGTGLGIYVCKQFAEAHGGKVWAVSDGIGKGSEFGFWIPKHKTRKHTRMAARSNSGTQQVVNQYSQPEEFSE